MVIREKPSYNYPKPQSETNSDTEYGLLGSASSTDTESLNSEPVTSPQRVYKPPPIKVTNFEDLVNVRKSGKKKMRRYENRRVLQTLNEDEEYDAGIMENYNNPFSRLFEDERAMAFWQQFIDKSEEDQSRIMRAFTKQYCGCREQENALDLLEPGKPGRISTRLRRIIKIKKNLSLSIVQACEDDLINFFKTTPSEVYVKFPLTSFDRLLIHAIAQYHKLKSTSLPVQTGLRRSVEVYNHLDSWVPAHHFITDYIKELRKEIHINQ